jgi:hypothetical protein
VRERSSSPAPVSEYVEEPNVLERRAADYLRRENDRKEAELRPCEPGELAALDRLERWSVARAFLAGALSGGILGSAEIFVRRGSLEGMEGMEWREQLPYWAAFGILTLVVTVVEILFLYWNALRSAARISRVAGVPLVGDPFAVFMARGLARAALEFPNPRDPLFGIDPYARTPRWKLATWALAYRMKVGVSSFVLRVLLRRVLARAALRGLIPMIMGPLYAFWNAYITWRVVREARVRSLGPFAVKEVSRRIGEALEDREEADRRLVVEAVGEMMIRSEDAHPNFALLLSHLLGALGVRAEDVDVDWATRRERLRESDGEVQEAVLKALVLASLLDGRVRRGERELLRDASGAAGRNFHRDAFRRVHEKLLAGARIEDADLEAVWR